jgi:hypothetical protein
VHSRRTKGPGGEKLTLCADRRRRDPGWRCRVSLAR